MTVTDSRLNNFDLIRLIAALQVVFVHAVGHTEVLDNASVWLRGVLGVVLAFPGVPVFFVISGFLIAKSWERSRDQPLSYFWRRALRIYPALVVCVVVRLVVLGGFGFLKPEVLASMGFWAWLVGQLSVVQFFNPECFRGFGVGVVNGALWTISVEIQFYLLVPILYRIAYPRSKNGRWRQWVLPVSSLASFAVFCWVDARTNGPGGFSEAGLVPKLLFVSFAAHWWMFAIGVAMHRHFERIRGYLEGRFPVYFIVYAAVALLRVHLVGREGDGEWLFYLGYLPERLLLAAATVSGAYTVRGLSSRLLRGTDISYGVYIYHFLLINVLIELGVMTTAVWVLPVFLLTLVAGVLSWVLIEKRALALKNHVPGVRKRPAGGSGTEQPEW